MGFRQIIAVLAASPGRVGASSPLEPRVAALRATLEASLDETPSG